MGRLVRALASVRLAAWLIGILGGFLLLSFVIPQRGVFPAEDVASFLGSLPGPIADLISALGLDSIFTSELFLLLVAVLLVNVAVCTIRRLSSRVRARRRPPAASVPTDARVIRDIAVDSAASALRSAGARAEYVEGESRYAIRRGGVGFAGSMLLHLALIGLAAGGLVTGLTTFRGEMVLAEGQTRADQPESYLTIAQTPRIGPAFGDFAITLERMEFTYEEDTVVDAVARVGVSEPSGRRSDEARVNYPLEVQGKSFLLLDAGHSVWLTVANDDGEQLADSFINLAALTDLGYADSIDVAGERIAIVSRPDAATPLEQPPSRGLELRDPIVGLAAGNPGSPEDYLWVAPGETIQLGQVAVTVNEVRVWNRFLVRADGGRYIVYVSFVVVILGVLVRFLDPDRYVNVVVRDRGDGTGDAHVWGRTRYDLGMRRDLVEQVAGELRRQAMAAPEDGEQ